MPFTIKVNGAAAQRRRRWRHPPALGLARRARHDRHQVRLRHGALRRLHRAYERRADAVLRLSHRQRRRCCDHHHRGHRRDAGRGRRSRKPGSIWKSSNAAIASRDRSCRRARCSRRTQARAIPISTRRCPAISAGAAPMSASARPSSRPRPTARRRRIGGNDDPLPHAVKREYGGSARRLVAPRHPRWRRRGRGRPVARV